jgi:hypothetical protein
MHIHTGRLLIRFVPELDGDGREVVGGGGCWVIMHHSSATQRNTYLHGACAAPWILSPNP